MSMQHTPIEIQKWIVGFSPNFHYPNENKEIEIDYFVRFENLQEDLSKIGIKIQKVDSSKIEDDSYTTYKRIKIKLYDFMILIIITLIIKKNYFLITHET